MRDETSGEYFTMYFPWLVVKKVESRFQFVKDAVQTAPKFCV